MVNHDSDQGSTVTIRALTVLTDSEGSAAPAILSREAAAPVGGPLDLAALGAAPNLTVEVGNVRLSPSGRYVAELRVRNVGPAPVGRRIAVVFPDLPNGVALANASGVNGDGSPYVNMSRAVSTGGLAVGARSDAVLVEFENPNFVRFPWTREVFSSGPNQPPAFDSVGPLAVTPGDVLQVQLSATDPDGDKVTFALRSNSLLPAGTLNDQNVLTFTPLPADVGVHQFMLAATDGAATVTQIVTLNVIADLNANTRVSGRIHDAAGNPLASVLVELGALDATTAADGSFTLDLGGAGPLPDAPVVIHGEAIAGPAFALTRAALPQVLGRAPLDGVNNIIARPIVLTPLDAASGQTVNPAQDTTIEPAAIPGAALFIAAGTLRDGQGALFNGNLTITDVPLDQTPAPLPPNVAPDLAVSIAPGDLEFTSPAVLTLPNRAGWSANLAFDLFAVNPVTGAVEDMGDGRVSADGGVVETVSGGMLTGGVAFFAPQLAPPQDLEAIVFNLTLGVQVDWATRSFTSDVELHSGAVTESHDLATYSSQGQTRGLRLVYDSLRADPQPIVHFGYPEVDTVALAGANAGQLRMRANLEFAGPSAVVVQSPDHFFSVPAGQGRVDAALQIDLAAEPSGVYAYQVELGLFLLGQGGVLAGTSRIESGRFVHVNSLGGPLGNGWGLAGWQQIVEQPDGAVLLIDRDGGELLFEPPAVPGEPHVSPPGDFSSVQKEPNGTYRRTLRDRTVYEFNADHRLASILDRNANQTLYDYDGQGRLVSITDPVNLATTFNYTGDRVTSITDPAGRTTAFEYDAAGNLIRVVDPDQSQREFS